MPTVARRITSSGTLFISGEFDEVTKDVISLTTEAYYANFFDEVDLFGVGVAMRETNSGTILVSNGLNEVEKPL
jgi:hypothetical protein